MCRMSSTSPTINRTDAAEIIMIDSAVFGTKTTYIDTVAANIAIPPSIAVGRVCHRSGLGFATKLYRRARYRTRYVNNAPVTRLAAAVKYGLLKRSIEVSIRLSCLS